MQNFIENNWKEGTEEGMGISHKSSNFEQSA